MTAARSVEPVAIQFQTMEQQRRANLAGMWVFISTEILFFAGVFLAFTVYRTRFGPTFAEAAGHLDLMWGSINTAVLLTSGFTMSLVDPAMEERNRGRALKLLAATILLGLAFLAIKGHSYATEIHDHLAPFYGYDFHFEGAHPGHADIFFSFYFVLTGLHAVHMSIGVIALIVMFVLVFGWRDPDRIERQVRIVALYWAFVDVVWIFIFPTVYLLRG